MSTMEGNLAALRARDPETAARVERAAPAPFEIVRARSGDPTARIGEAWLHSRYDPAREAARAAEAEDLLGIQAAVALGLGLGYALEALAARLPDRPLVAAVADPGEVRAAFEARDLRALIARPGLAWIVGGDAVEIRRRLENALSAPECAFTRPVPLRTSAERAPAFYRTVVDETSRIADLHRTSLRALDSFGSLWTSNALRNLAALGRAGSVASLEGSWAGRPAAVLGAGPSLDEVLPHLARRRGGLVVAVDTALRPCLAAGVRPDLVVAADAQAENLRDFEGLDVSGLDLVATHLVDPRTFRLGWRRIFAAVTEDALGRWISEAAGGLGSLRAGGSVSTLAFDLARRAGAARVVFAGVDLSWEARTHARGAAEAPAEGGRFSTLESAGRARGLGARRARARDGAEVETTETLAAYAAWLEGEIARGGPEVVVAGRSLLRAGKPCLPADVPGLLGDAAWAPPPPRVRALPPLAERLEDLRVAVLAGLAALDAGGDLLDEAGGRGRFEDAAAEGVAEALRALAVRPPLDPVLRSLVAPILDRLDGRARPDEGVVAAGRRAAARLRDVIGAVDDVLGR